MTLCQILGARRRRAGEARGARGSVMSQGLSSLVRTRRVVSGVQVWHRQACLEICVAYGFITTYEIIFFAKIIALKISKRRALRGPARPLTN